MKIRELTIAGAFEIVPQVHGDQRGLFTEGYRFDRLAEAVGRPSTSPACAVRCATWWSTWGHGFCALTDDATLTYLCSTTYRPTGEHAVHPLDPDPGIEWPADAPLLSARDAAAPSWAEVVARGMLPSYDACLAESIYSCRSAPDRPQKRRTTARMQDRTPIE
ncbi:hypothetical protein QF037_000321 [Streptomyces canus]|uniref:dTDP-4-dehydrorhamnose 3,5-epimerase family protein n=1 Tax=Streptomyces canus TaxID=58343 RepID=UPI002781C239|nr:hypothetical protein [Streptomyces canus]